MGYHHQYGAGPGDFPPESEPPAPVAPRSLLPHEARRLIWEGARIVMRARSERPGPLPRGAVVLAFSLEPVAIRGLLPDPEHPLVCVSGSASSGQRQEVSGLAEQLASLGYRSVFTVAPIPSDSA